jgi:hypothetical protein
MQPFCNYLKYSAKNIVPGVLIPFIDWGRPDVSEGHIVTIFRFRKPNKARN